MRTRFLLYLAVFVLLATLPVWEQTTGKGENASSNLQSLGKVPAGVILVKGAWSSASDSVTPLPEGTNVTEDIFRSQYFGMTYTLPAGWTEKYKGPPPSENGRYTLAQIIPAETYKGSTRASILITAQDMFFTPLPTANALELIDFTNKTLPSDYKTERTPGEIKIAGHSFRLLEYWSPVAGLHWYMLATEIRCHTVELVLTSRDTKLLESLMQGLNKIQLPEEASPTGGSGGGAVPVCVKDYANDENNIVESVDPVFSERRFNSVPVRIIIDKEGKVKHIHFLSAFPDQAKAITEALQQWKFKPYLQNGQPVEVETGILFGRAAAYAVKDSAMAR